MFPFAQGPGLFDRCARDAAVKSGIAPPPGLLPAETNFLADFKGDGGAGAHRAVQAMLGTDQFDKPAPTVDQAFTPVFALLQESDCIHGDLMLEVQAIKEKIKARLAESREARLTQLRAERDRLHPLCRAAFEREHQLSDEQAQAQMRLNMLAPEVAKARTALKQMQLSKPSASSYPTPAELEAWLTRCNTANQTVADWEARYQRAENDLASLERKLQQARTEFNQLDAEYRAVEARIAAGAPSIPTLNLPPDVPVPGGFGRW